MRAGALGKTKKQERNSRRAAATASAPTGVTFAHFKEVFSPQA
jgi:hypothetical protein